MTEEEELQHKTYITSKAKKVMSERAEMIRELQGQLDELQIQYDQVAPTTPTGTPDWYLKWIGVLTVVIGIFLQNAGVYPWGQFCYLLGAMSWTLVGIYWNDKAVMLGSVIPATATALTLARTLLGS